MIPERPFVLSSGLVRQNTHTYFACFPVVINVFEPFITYSPVFSSSIAVVFVAPASDPAFASVHQYHILIKLVEKLMI